jgi:Cof subfamily protein (haloacid dehalogenase superfamily)
MGKFDNILLCTDLDDTLLTTEKLISEENRRAIEYFKSEGGLFTFATGRVPVGAKLMLDYITPNAPMVCFNGAGVYDFKNEKLLWSMELDEEAVEVLEFIEEKFPFVGIEVCTEQEIYFCRMNHIVAEHQQTEKLPDLFADYHEIPHPWKKVLFMQEEDQVPLVREALQTSKFADKYSFVQSSPNFYELLPKGASKGSGLAELAKLMRVPIERTIGVGDNENDISLVETAGVGVAVANAIPELRDVADYITVDNNSHAISTVIYSLNKGNITMQ